MLFLLTKEERDAEIYLAANSRDQASQALNYQKQIVRDSPALNSRVEGLQYKMRFKGNGTCVSKTVPTEPDKLDGKKVTGYLVDEIHEAPDKKMQGVLVSGTKATYNPLGVIVTTAGFHIEYPITEDIQIGKDILEEKVEDDSTFYAFFTLDSEEEIDRPEVWVKANPALGIVQDEEDMFIDYKKAKLSLSEFRTFIVKNLNVFQQDIDTWIPDEDYKTCFKQVALKKFYGRKVYLGIDLSASRDLSSLVATIADDKGKLHVYPYFFFPDKNKKGKIRAGSIDLQNWIDKGFIEAHEGKIINYDKILDVIKFFNDNFEVVALGYDPYNFTIIESKINNEKDILIDLVACQQNTMFYNFPIKHVERLIYSKQINLSRNPVLRWNAMNMKTYTDGNGNIKPMKNKSLDSIDGMVALFMSVAMYCKYHYASLEELMASLNKNQ
jgi:phage terminase large subunit-like protein